MALVCPMNFDKEKLRSEVQVTYTQVAGCSSPTSS